MNKMDYDKMLKLTLKMLIKYKIDSKKTEENTFETFDLRGLIR